MLLAVVIFAVVAAGTLQLKHMGERGVQVERDLQGIVTELRAQDALEWRVISGRVAPAEVREELLESRERARWLTSGASWSDPEHGHADVAALQDRYSAVVDEELRLLSIGDLEEAEEFDEAQVDPAFEAALESLEEHAGEVSEAAARARVLSDVGVVAIVALSLALTAWVQNRRKRAEVRRRAERRSEARYRALIDQSSDLVLVCERAGRVTYLSPSAERLFGRSAEATPAELDLAVVAHPEDWLALSAALSAAAPGSSAPVEIRLQGSQGERTFEVSVQDLCDDPAVGGVVVTGHDITDRQALQQELQHRALHDALTGLPNRALLADRFDQALRAARRDGDSVGLLLIDLDRFKEINDTLG
ncbi:MAG: diguanylate cyclase domain-containing protein, partial [Actinomycetes bacterium]